MKQLAKGLFSACVKLEKLQTIENRLSARVVRAYEAMVNAKRLYDSEGTLQNLQFSIRVADNYVKLKNRLDKLEGKIGAQVDVRNRFGYAIAERLPGFYDR